MGYNRQQTIMRKKLLTFLLTIVASLGVIRAEVYSGTCGDNLRWNLVDSVLTISGSGSMRDYDQYNNHSPWYSSRNDIKHIVLPDNLTSIGSFAFSSCSNITEISIPQSCRSIGNGAFEYCYSLKGVYITDLEAWCRIGFSLYYSFGNPNQLRHGTNPLYYAKHLYLNGELVTEVKGSVGLSMSGCIDLKKVELPENVTSIGISAFFGCKNLEYINIPKALKEIERYAFYGCSNLTSIDIPETCTSIGESAFGGCYSLTSVKIPSTTSVYTDMNSSGVDPYQSAFAGVPNVEYHGTNSAAPWGAWCLNGYVDNYLVFSDSAMTDLVVCSRAAKGNVTIPHSVTAFESEVFQDCKGITSITIPESIIDVPNGAFKGCGKLAEIYWNVKKAHDYTYSSTPFYYSSGSSESNYNNRKQILHFTFGDSVKYIPAYLCAGMENLGTVIIEGEPDTIGYSTFDNCKNLKKVVIPNLESWCNITFSNNSANPLKYSHSLRIDDSEISELAIPASISQIKSYAFYGGRSFKSIIIPEQIDSIGNMAFADCSGVVSIDVPSNVQYIAYNAFGNVPNISVMPNTANYTNAPWGAKSLNGYVDGNIVYNNSNKTDILACATSAVGEIEIPISVKNIKSEAFSECTNLVSIKLPTSLESIQRDAFYNVPNIEYIGTLTDEKHWGARCLNGYVADKLIFSNSNKNHLVACSSSAEGKIAIPNTVDSIGNHTFLNCRKITNLFFKSHVPPQISSIALSDLDKNNTIINVFAKDKSLYLTKEYWKDYTIQSAFSTNTIINSTSINLLILCNACDEKDNIIVSCGIAESDTLEGNVIEYIGLEPNSEYKDIPIFIITNDNDYDTIHYSFSTTALELTTKPSKSVSATTAILLAETNMSDAEVSCGFEYKRNDAPDDMAGTKVFCPVASGQMAGRLKNLRDDTYYKYRAFYQSAAGNMYYGDWQYIFTGDVAVEFDPILYTYGATVVRENEATISGYALAGSEDFTEQGFEYWAESRANNGANAPHRMPAALNEHFFVQASGIALRATLNNLDAGTVYRYRVYGKVGDQYYYGSEQTFTTTGTYTPPTYTITFANWDGTELQSSQVTENEMPEYVGATPERPEDEQNTYFFNGWSPAIVAATADATYTATYQSEPKSQGIEDVQGEDVQCTKVLRDGQIYILRGDKTYTVTGQEIR